MGKRFTPTNIADQRAIRFHLQLREIEQTMPKLGVNIVGKTIIVFLKENPAYQRHYSVEGLNALDLSRAKEMGGDLTALLASYTRPKPRLPSSEIQEAVHGFFTGEDE